MLEHGLDGWAFGFGRGRRTLGTTRVTPGTNVGTVRLSRHLLAHGRPDQIEDTLRHEIAHAVAFLRHGRAALGHGPLWREVAREIGARPRATCSEGLDLPAPHRLACRRCGTVVGLFRSPKHAPDAYRHKGCGGTFRRAADDEG
jgi:predicted SprT family Zn-dependent metalloprotease